MSKLEDDLKKWRENKEKILLSTVNQPNLTEEEVNNAFDDLVVTQNYFEEEISQIIEKSGTNKKYPKLYRGNDNISNNYFGFLSIPGNQDFLGFFKIVAIGKTIDEINNNVKKYIEESNTSDTIIIGQDRKWTPICKNPTKYTKNKIILDRENKEEVIETFETCLQQKKEYLTNRPDHLNDSDSNVDYQYSKYFANIKHLEMNHNFMLKKISLFNSYIKMNYESFRRLKEPPDWYDYYYRTFKSIGVENIDTKEDLINIVEKYKNEDYVNLSDKELDDLKNTTIYKINNITVF